MNASIEFQTKQTLQVIQLIQSEFSISMLKSAETAPTTPKSDSNKSIDNFKFFESDKKCLIQEYKRQKSIKPQDFMTQFIKHEIHQQRKGIKYPKVLKKTSLYYTQDLSQSRLQRVRSDPFLCYKIKAFFNETNSKQDQKQNSIDLNTHKSTLSANPQIEKQKYKWGTTLKHQLYKQRQKLFEKYSKLN